jgi:23S rRNA (cytidine1920-2'-O)/16S rRNA (cytidine1409-2'-O)-methyltransferase
MGGAEPSQEVFVVRNPLSVVLCESLSSVRTYVRFVCEGDHSPTFFSGGTGRHLLKTIQSGKAKGWLKSCMQERSAGLGAGRRYRLRRMKKARIDAVLAERGLFPSRTAAAGAVRAGAVRVGQDGPVAVRPSQLVEPEAALIVEQGPRFVSRGGIKLDNALEALGIDVSDLDCLDVGASTGGFTDCMLQRGAARVVAADVAYGQIDVSLRKDPRVTVIERLNARELEPGDLPFAPALATVDVSFISLVKVLPAVARCLAPDGGEVLAMVKPQFELGRKRVSKGVVRSEADRHEAILGVALAARELGLAIHGFASSGLPGPKGNRETFVWCGTGGKDIADLTGAIAKAELVEEQ